MKVIKEDSFDDYQKELDSKITDEQRSRLAEIEDKFKAFFKTDRVHVDFVISSKEVNLSICMYGEGVENLKQQAEDLAKKLGAKNIRFYAEAKNQLCMFAWVDGMKIDESLTEANEEGAWFGPRTDYKVKIQKVKPGTKVHNKLENANYITDEKKCYVITGTVGEQWPVDAKKVQQKYICDMRALEAGKPVEAKINPEAVKGDKGYFTVCKAPMEVNTDWGDILHAEPGDMLRSDGPGQEPNRVVDPGVFKTTYQKLNEEIIDEAGFKDKVDKVIGGVNKAAGHVKNLAGTAKKIAADDSGLKKAAGNVETVANAISTITNAMKDGSGFFDALKSLKSIADDKKGSTVNWSDTKATANNVSLHDGPSSVINTLRSLAKKSAASENENAKEFSTLFSKVANQFDNVLTNKGWWKIHDTVQESYENVDQLLENKEFLCNIKYIYESLLKEANMSDKVIWSTNATRDYISGMGDEEKFNALVDRGYDPEMLGNAENIDDVIARDDYMWQDDVGDFDEEIAPMLNDQTRSGVVIMVNENGDGKAAYVEDLKGGDIDPEVNDVEIVYDGDGLVWKGHGNGVDKEFMLFAIPEGEESFKGFVKACLASSGYFIDDENDPLNDDQIADEIADTFDMEDEVQLLNNFCDWTKVGEVCPRLQPYGIDIEEGCHKEELTEASTKNKQELANELEEIKPLADEYGFDYFTSMPFTAFEGDPESIEAQFPEFFKIVKQFFEKMGIVDEAELNDSDVLDDLWDTNIDQHDWNVIMRVGDLIVKGKTPQIEKDYMMGYESPLKGDKEMLADREAQEDEFGESLEEAKCVRCGKDEKHLDKDGLCADCDDELNEAVLGSLDSQEEKDAQKRAFAKRDQEEDDAKNHAEYKKHPSKFDIKADEALTENKLDDLKTKLNYEKGSGDIDALRKKFKDMGEPEKNCIDKLRNKLKEDTITDEDELNFDDPENQSEEDLAKELADAYKSEYDGTPEAEQIIYDDIVKHFEDPDYAELVIEILKNDFNEEVPEVEESLEKDLQDRYARAAEKYRKYAGYAKDEELEEDLSEPAMHRVCYEENLSMEELKGALGR